MTATERQQRWRADNPEKVKAIHRKHRYGMTQEEFDKRRAEQGNRCAICLIEFSDDDKQSTPRVDHRHVDGKVRGLLCYACNTGLGFFRDDLVLLARALAYLKG
jgi:nitrate/TMAO reductase-like tetraheme cytochrome c subunit